MKLNKKILIPCITILAILLLGVGTNPNKEDYVTWAKEQLMNRTDDQLEKGLISFMGEPLIKNYTTSKNFLIFSIYDTTVDDNHKVKVIGAFKNFIPISGKVEDTQKK